MEVTAPCQQSPDESSRMPFERAGALPAIGIFMADYILINLTDGDESFSF